MKKLKRIVTCALTLILALNVISMPPAYAASNADTGTYVTTGDVNMRSGAGTSYEIVTTVPNKSKVNVTNTSNSKWYKATYKNAKGKTYKGYISSKYLKKSSQDTKAQVYVATGDVNLRSGAGTDNKVLAVVPKNAVVTVTNTSNSKWYKVTYKNAKGKTYKGYVSSKYLKKSKVYVATGDVNLRSSASKSGKILAVVSKNEAVAILSTSNSKWYQVIYRNPKGKEYKGYVSSKYLKKSNRTDIDNSKQTQSKGKTYVATGDVNLRSSASTSGKVLAVVPKGATVTVTDTSNSKWYKATYKNSKGKTYKGYISSKYLKKK